MSKSSPPRVPTVTSFLGLEIILLRYADELKHGNRIRCAACKIVHRAHRAAKRYVADADERAGLPRSTKNDECHRQWLYYQSYVAVHRATIKDGTYSHPVELWSREAPELFGFTGQGGDATKAVEAICLEGARIGLWKYTRCYSNEGPEGDMRNHQPARLLLMGDWWKSEPLKVEPARALHRKRPSAKGLHGVEVATIENAVARSHRAFMAMATAPSRAALEAEALRMVANHETNKAGHRYVFEVSALGIKGPNLFNRILSHEISRSVGGIEGGVSEGSEDGAEWLNRTYTPTWSLCPKWIRGLYRLHGELVVGVDARALHPNIIAKLLRDAGLAVPDFLIGRSHDKIAALLGIKKHQAKTINLAYWNSRKGDFSKCAVERRFLLEEFHAYMCEHHPEVLQFLADLCEKHRFRENGGTKILAPHKSLFRILRHWETVVLNETLEELQAKGVTCDSCYDAVYVAESEVARAKTVFNAALARHGIPTDTKAGNEKEEEPEVNPFEGF